MSPTNKKTKNHFSITKATKLIFLVLIICFALLVIISSQLRTNILKINMAEDFEQFQLGTNCLYQEGDNLEQHQRTINSELLAEIKENFPEDQVIADRLIDFEVNPNLQITEEITIDVTFIDEGAGYKNSFGFFTYKDTNSDGVIGNSEILSQCLIFENSSKVGSGGNLQTGDTATLGTFPAGTNIGFYLIVNGATNNPETTYYTIDNLNSDGHRHVAMLLSENQEELFLGIEDLSLGDRDYNDILFTISGFPKDLIKDIAKRGNIPGVDDSDPDTPGGDDSGSNSNGEKCGNGIVEVGEICDDGNSDNFDGCNNDCNYSLVSKPLANCLGQGEVMAFVHDLHREPIDLELAPKFDQIILFTELTADDLEVVINFQEKNLDLVTSFEEPEKINVYSLNVAPNHIVNIKANNGQIGEQIHGIISQPKSKPFLDLADLNLVTTNSNNARQYLTKNTYDYLLLNTYNNQELSVKINSLADQLIIHQQQFSPEQFAPVKGFYSGQFHTKKAGYFDFVATPLEESYWLHYDCPISNNRPGGGSNSGGSSFQDQTDQKQRDPEHPAANEEDPDLSPEPEINKPEPETTPDKKLAILPQRIPLDQYQKEYPLVTQSRAKDDLAKTIEIPRTGQVSQKLLEEYQTKSYFPDSSVNHPFYEAAVNLALQGVVQGDGSGRINLDQPILRSEMAKIILKALEVDVPQNFAAIFPDTYADEWYQPFVNYSYHAGIFKGYQNGHFGPGDPVNYGQILAIISRSFPTHFSVSEDTYANYYKVMLRKNLLPQSLKSSQDFLRPLTRGEVFEILYRTLVVVDNQENHYYDQLEISFPGLNLENIPTNRTLISNSSVWLADLINGAGFYSSTQNDNLVVFAHSSDYNWNHNENGTIFKPLISGLNVGDEVIITKNNTQVKYQITAKRLVEGSDAQALKEAAMNNSLTIFTCDYDLSKRYLFTARIL